MKHFFKSVFGVMIGTFLLCVVNSHATESPNCNDLFQQIDLLKEETEKADNDKKKIDGFQKIISATIFATESYLNNCTDSNNSLSNQAEAIQKLEEMTKQECSSKASATQLIDVNNDANSELLLHAKLSRDEEFYGCVSGFSVLFFFNTETKKWTGYPIWPSVLIEKKFNEISAVDLIDPQYHPKIYMLDFKDKKGRAFMAIESTLQGGDSTTNLLSVIRWDGQKGKSILNLSLNDWCGQSYKWIIEKNGIITVPEAKATDRCKKRKKTVYHLDQL